MLKPFAIFLLSLFLLTLTFSQIGNENNDKLLAEYNTADKLFSEAENLYQQKNYDEEKEVQLNKKALEIFRAIAQKIKNDSLAFFCHSKMGLLWHYFDSLDLAKAEYKKALDIKPKQVADSFLFKPLLFIGSIYYNRFSLDSAYTFYKKAEAITEKYNTPLNEQERLYNRIGTLHYESGNYKQAINYFERALSLLKPSSFYNDFFVNYKSNIASSLLNLERFSEADSIYNTILPYHINTNEILQNIGSVNLLQGDADKALSYFKKVKYNNNLNILLYNKIGKAFLLKNNLDSANKYLTLAQEENKKWNGAKKNILYGVTLQTLGEKLVIEKNYKDAIEHYQKAITQFYPNYNEVDIYKNPENFSGFFSYINLFTTLTAKANALDKLFEQTQEINSLNASLNAYRAAFTLADYVERSYESDQARLFLNKIKYSVHDNPIRISLQLYELTKNKQYLENAYYFDQQNKASILSLNVQQQAVKNQLISNVELFKEENNIKKIITSFSLKAAQINDSIQLQQLNESIRDHEIKLSKLHEKMNNLDEYKSKQFTQHIPGVSQLQSLLNKKSALLSYHLSKTALVTLCITSKEIAYYKLPIESLFSLTIDSLKSTLSDLSIDKNVHESTLLKKLYTLTITPIWKHIKGHQNLIIIPDDELNSLPFEVFMNEEGDYLLQNFSVQYLYSTALLNNIKIEKNGNGNTLAMAPFSDTGYGLFSKLAYSKKEVENIQGDTVLDTAATKLRFLSTAQNYKTLHLATHTIIDNTNPDQSLISFYPIANTSVSDNNLYVQEIYNLNLTKTNLVILSACETGAGKLAKGEGLLSLARAFTYAGCPKIIASLWKADDKSTAWIIQRYYDYQKKGLNTVTALKKAKLDYLKSPEIEKRFKAPNYWAHLVLTGIPEKDNSTNYWLWAILGIVRKLSFILYRKYKSTK